MARIFSKGNKTACSYVVFFDLDRTLTGRISGKALALKALKEGLMPPGWIISAIRLYLLYKTGLKTSREVIDTMTGWTRGRSEADIAKLCSEVSRAILIPSLYSQALTEIEKHKKNMAEVIILSSTLDYICAEISDYLGIDGYISSSLEVVDGSLTGRLAGNLCFGEEKLRLMSDYCKNNTMSLNGSWYYGDSISDLPALLATGTPVCINPDGKLAREARHRNW